MTVKTHERKWWKQASVYQIYPASFCDSNGDGMGDLPGVTSKLDYIASLGVEIIWICPMYDSPQVDMGYDISNYEDVYPPYGTLQDMEVLIRETHARGMRIMLDLVINHTSDQHAWFKESRTGKDSPKRDWYIWRPAKYDADGNRKPPNNWCSLFGTGSVWEWDEASGEYYLHLFAREQPDLNWENPECRRAIYASAMEFWLERGVDGFRIDTVNMYSKPPGLPDAPVVDPNAEFQPAGMVFCNGPRMHEFLGEMNAILARYGAITVGELPFTPDPADVLRYVSAANKELDMVFQFDLANVGYGKTSKFDTTPKNWTLPEIKAAIGLMQGLIRGTDGWTTAFLENHDQARSVSRFADDSAALRVQGAKMLALMQTCLSGTQYIYQGQELGCVNAPGDSYPIENYRDIDSTMYYEAVRKRGGDLKAAFAALQHLARDHARLPMPWDGAAKYGGFSQAAEDAGVEVSEPWMKPHPLVAEINVASQLKDPDSVLAFWRAVVAFRKEHTNLLVYGDYRGMREQDPDLFTFVKEESGGGANGKGRAVVVLNFTKKQKAWAAPSAEELGLESDATFSLVPVMGTRTGKMAADVPLEAFEGRVYLVGA